jgi:hypothetical protein
MVAFRRLRLGNWTRSVLEPEQSSRGGLRQGLQIETSPAIFLLIQIHDRDFVHSAAGQVQAMIGRRDHVSHHAAARGNFLLAESFGLGVEPDQRIRTHA